MIVFLSAVSSEFRSERAAIASDLRAIGATVRVQEDFQTGTGTLLEKLEQYIATCDLVIAIVGAMYGASPTKRELPPTATQSPRSYTQWEYFMAMGERLDGTRVPARPTRIYVAADRDAARAGASQTLTAARRQRQFVKMLIDSGRDRGEFRDEPDLLRMVLRDNQVAGQSRSFDDRVPYKGLAAFTEDDADIFYGRAVAVSRLEQAVEKAPFVIVTGSSGSGKSSLVRAGLMARLQRDDRWRFIVMRPGVNPLANLAIASRRACAAQGAGGGAPQDAVDDVVVRLATAGAGRSRHVLLVIDQLEELFVLNERPVVAQFIDGVKALQERVLAEHAIDLKVVATLRADHVGSALDHSSLVEILQGGDIKLGPMNRIALREVIVRPVAERAVFEDGLVERLLDDVGDEPGNLPLLQFCLYSLWEQRRGSVLTNAAYDALGGLKGAIGNRAEETFRGASPPRQQALRWLATRLVSVPEDGAPFTKRRLTIDEVDGVGPDVRDLVHEMIDLLAADRLVVTDFDAVRGQRTIEFAHEAIIKHWPTLDVWVREARDLIQWRQQLTRHLTQWKREGKRSDFLLRGMLLDEARLWLVKQRDAFTRDECEYIEESDRAPAAHSPVPTMTLDVVGDAASLSTIRQLVGGAGAHPPGDGVLRLGLTLLPRDATPAPRHERIDGSALRLALQAADTPEPAPMAQPVTDGARPALQDLVRNAHTSTALLALAQQGADATDPAAQLQARAYAIDMRHARGEYQSAASGLAQELALLARDGRAGEREAIALRIRLLHHQMFYEPVGKLWDAMVELLTQLDAAHMPTEYGEVLCMLGGNLGSLRGRDEESDRYLAAGISHARATGDSYLLARCLRKQADYLRAAGQLDDALRCWSEAMDASTGVNQSRQSLYLLCTRGDLERQRGHDADALRWYQRAEDAARAQYIPGWIANTCLGRATLLGVPRHRDAIASLEMAEIFFGETGNAWGMMRCKALRGVLQRAQGAADWSRNLDAAIDDAVRLGYRQEERELRQQSLHPDAALPALLFL